MINYDMKSFKKYKKFIIQQSRLKKFTKEKLYFKFLNCQNNHDIDNE